MMKTRLFSNIDAGTGEYVDQASYKGITLKTLFSLLLAILSAVIVGVSFRSIFQSDLTENEITQKLIKLITMLSISSIVGFISVMVGRMNVKAARICTPIYAVCEGMFVGTISMMGELYYSGIVLIACVATFSCFGVMLALFGSGIIRNHTKFQLFGIAFGSSLIVGLLITMLCSIFVPAISSNFWFLFIIECLFLVYGCISLLMNFIECTQIVKAGCDKSYEWSASLGLLVSILYIYVEIIRIAMILLDRRD